MRICLGSQMVEFVMLVTVAAAVVKVEMAAVLKIEMHCCSSTLCCETYPIRMGICLRFLSDDQGLQMVEFVMLMAVAAAVVKVEMAAVLKVEMHCCSSTLCCETYPIRMGICLRFPSDDQGLQMVEFLMLMAVAAAVVKVEMHSCSSTLCCETYPIRMGIRLRFPSDDQGLQMVEFLMLMAVAAAVVKVEMHCCSSTLCWETYPIRMGIRLLFLSDDQGLQMVEFVMLMAVAAAVVKVEMAAVLKVEMHCCSSTLCWETYPIRMGIRLLFLSDDQGLQMVEFVMLMAVAAAVVKVEMAAVLKVEMHCCSSTLCWETYPIRTGIRLLFLSDDQGLQMVEFLMLMAVAAAVVKVEMRRCSLTLCYYAYPGRNCVEEESLVETR